MLSDTDRRFADVLVLEYLQQPSALLLQSILVCFFGIRIVVWF